MTYTAKVQAYNTLIAQIAQLRGQVADIGTAAGALETEPSGIVDVANGAIHALERLENELSLLSWKEACGESAPLLALRE